MGIVPKGGESKAVESIRYDVEPVTEGPTSTSLSRGDALKILKQRGIDYKDLKTKTKDQLIEMI